MLATITALERALTDENLYHRHLEKSDSRKAGAFLAVPFWVAHYWMIRGDYDWVRAILEAGLKYANYPSFFAEEAYFKAGQMLGNFSRAIVHAALSAPLSIKTALQETSYFLLRDFIACRLLSAMQKLLATNNAHE